MCVKGRRIKLGKTQGGLQCCSQDLTKGGGGRGGVQYFFEKKIYFHKTNLQKKSYIQYQTHYIQKKRNKGKKETRNIKRRKKKK